ncbi:MAG: hypothetical protein EXS18_03925 [Verrucomicrobiae bacterium]|nr:hypothetical protein [Verrucomicrobiae bacterium]
MNFLNSGIFIGQWFGINVRLHFTFVIFAFWRLQNAGHIGYGIAYIAGLYLCILLHEFGHALAARWCDGEASEILLWPLGGLAFCRPAFNPTAHLITTVAGPFVTLVLWLLFGGLQLSLKAIAGHGVYLPGYVYWFVSAMRDLNLLLLLFNLLPAFPMDGGRIVRDTIWHWMSAEKATKFAVILSQLIAIVAIGWAAALLLNPLSVPPLPLGISPLWALILALFILPQAANERQVLAFEGGGTYEFSIRERIKRGKRKRAFHQAVRERTDAETSQPFHRCHVCGRTENDDRSLDFRVCDGCLNGEEYCPEHLEKHKHVVS